MKNEMAALARRATLRSPWCARSGLIAHQGRLRVTSFPLPGIPCPLQLRLDILGNGLNRSAKRRSAVADKSTNARSASVASDSGRERASSSPYGKELWGQRGSLLSESSQKLSPRPAQTAAGMKLSLATCRRSACQIMRLSGTCSQIHLALLPTGRSRSRSARKLLLPPFEF